MPAEPGAGRETWGGACAPWTPAATWAPSARLRSSARTRGSPSPVACFRLPALQTSVTRRGWLWRVTGGALGAAPRVARARGARGGGCCWCSGVGVLCACLRAERHRIDGAARERTRGGEQRCVRCAAVRGRRSRRAGGARLRAAAEAEQASLRAARSGERRQHGGARGAAHAALHRRRCSRARGGMQYDRSNRAGRAGHAASGGLPQRESGWNATEARRWLLTGADAHARRLWPGTPNSPPACLPVVVYPSGAPGAARRRASEQPAASHAAVPARGSPLERAPAAELRRRSAGGREAPFLVVARDGFSRPRPGRLTC